MDEPPDAAARAEQQAIRAHALALLARREHARGELAAKLAQRGHASAAIEGVLDDLVVEGLQSDARYIETAIASKAERGIGPVRIRTELRQAGVAEAAVAAGLEAAAIDWPARAAAARAKRFETALPADFPARAKQMRFLQRRGFDADQITAVFAD